MIFVVFGLGLPSTGLLLWCVPACADRAVTGQRP